MVNIDSNEAIKCEKNDSFQDVIKPAVKEVENLCHSEFAEAVQDTKIEERLLDAQAIELLAVNIERPSARVHLDALVKKLRSNSVPTSTTPKSVIRRVNESSSTIHESISTSVKYIPINKFALDLGGYNSPVVTLYLDIPNVGSISKENIGCHFTKSSFDLIVNDLHGKNYRLLKDNLDKDIDPEKSKYLVKKNKITIKLAKVKAEYGSYDSWQNLSSKKSKKSKEKMKTNPSDSIMDMMKDMYDSGDDNMRKVIGETMLKQRNGELGKNQDMPSYPGMDNMDI
jgi:calcyclin binding protein